MFRTIEGKNNTKDYRGVLRWAEEVAPFFARACALPIYIDPDKAGEWY